MRLPEQTEREIEGLSDADRFKKVMGKLVNVTPEQLGKAVTIKPALAEQTFRITFEFTVSIEESGPREPYAEILELREALLNDPAALLRYLAWNAAHEVGSLKDGEVAVLLELAARQDEDSLDVLRPLVERLTPEARAFFADVIERDCWNEATEPIWGAVQYGPWESCIKPLPAVGER